MNESITTMNDIGSTEIDLPSKLKKRPLLDAYIAGIVDNHFNFIAKISKNEARKIGFKIQLVLKYKTEKEKLIGVMKKYSEILGIEPRVNKNTSTTYDRYEFIIGRRGDIECFLQQVQPYFVTQNKATSILLDDIIPRLERGDHSKKETFVELVGYIEDFRQAAGRNNRSKYDKEYFISKWDM